MHKGITEKINGDGQVVSEAVISEEGEHVKQREFKSVTKLWDRCGEFGSSLCDFLPLTCSSLSSGEQWVELTQSTVQPDPLLAWVAR